MIAQGFRVSAAAAPRWLRGPGRSVKSLGRQALLATRRCRCGLRSGVRFRECRKPDHIADGRWERRQMRRIALVVVPLVFVGTSAFVADGHPVNRFRACTYSRGECVQVGAEIAWGNTVIVKGKVRPPHARAQATVVRRNPHGQVWREIGTRAGLGCWNDALPLAHDPRRYAPRSLRLQVPYPGARTKRSDGSDCVRPPDAQPTADHPLIVTTLRADPREHGSAPGSSGGLSVAAGPSPREDGRREQLRVQGDRSASSGCCSEGDAKSDIARRLRLHRGRQELPRSSGRVEALGHQ